MQDKVRKIVELQERVGNQMCEITELEVKRVEKAIHDSRRGLKFDQIAKEWSQHNCNTCRCTPQREFFPQLGVKVTETVLESSSDYNVSDETIIELWLLDTREWAICQLESHNDSWQNHYSSRTRGELKVHPISYVVVCAFDADDIIEGIDRLLSKRLDQIIKKEVEQSSRLEKFRALEL